MIEFKSVIASLHKYERYGSEYYKILDLKECLDNISNLDVIDDVILTPFYLTPNGTYEIYDYELNIRNVNQSNKVNYFLKKTGKKSLEEINQEILKKLQLCYIEIEKEGNSKAIVALKKYLEYLLTSHSVKERIPEALGRFDNTNLYFEVFF